LIQEVEQQLREDMTGTPRRQRPKGTQLEFDFGV
jgi:hypothetical protein